ncbi:WG repeat protein [Chitinophaga niastensis]|uniref:WG repeat protein n=1 Tax=Chitinophaga niastensis TaxID=536980 RepID=A0A2P8HNZ4_CHINA|nr:WG repeat-containing protein [Chitinophaga niastensis]PSL47942.1 WG repeat protein [Chitinophaga niastensis]
MKHLFLVSSIFLFMFKITRAQVPAYDGGSRFVQGFARITKGNDHFYIDSTGQYAFDNILPNSNDYGTGNFTEKDQDDDTLYLHKNHVVVSRKGKLGILSSQGRWLLQPLYDTIDTRWDYMWTVSLNGKKSLYLPSGLGMPFRFNGVGYLDGRYFDVEQDGKWGVYDHQKDQVVIPFEYEGFDYCGGCETKSDYVFAQKNGKWGVVSFNNEILIPFEYDHQHIQMRSDEWVYCLFKEGKQMVINLHTKEAKTAPAEEEEDDEQLANGFVMHRKKDKYGLLNAAGKVVLDYRYDYIIYDSTDEDHHHVGINVGGKYGIADTTGKIIIPPKYDDWLYSYSGEYFTGKLHDKDVVFDKNGQPGFPDLYDQLDNITIDNYEGKRNYQLLGLQKKGLHGFYNPLTKKLVPPQYTKLEAADYNYASKGYFAVKHLGKNGVIDANGAVVVPAIYDEVSSAYGNNRNYLEVKRNNKKGYFDLQERKEIVPTQYDYIEELNDTAKLLQTTNYHGAVTLYGLRSAKGELIYPDKFNSITKVTPEVLLLSQPLNAGKNTYSVFNTITRQLYPLPYDTITPADQDALLIVSLQGKRQLYDAATGKVISGDYTKQGLPVDISTFSGGMASFQQQDKFGFIDPKGNVIVPAVYDGVFSFDHGTALVMQKKDSTDMYQYGFVDSTGKIIVPVKYDYMPNSNSHDYCADSFLVLYKAKENQLDYYMGYATNYGQIIIPVEYDQVYQDDSGNGFLVKKEGKYGVLDKAGNSIIPTIYDDIMLNERRYYGSTKTSFRFPLLCAKANTFQYITATGKALPLKLKEVTDFFVATNEAAGIPVEEAPEPAPGVHDSAIFHPGIQKKISSIKGLRPLSFSGLD